MTRGFALAAVAIALAARAASAQDTLTVERLQDAALASDPRAGQRSLLRAAADLRLKVIAADRLPQLEINGQGTHQSDVTRPTFGIPGVGVPDFPKERWQTTLDVEQRLYDGGDVTRRRRAGRGPARGIGGGLEVSLDQLRSDVNSAFYSAFLFEKRAAEYDALVEDLDARLAAGACPGGCRHCAQQRRGRDRSGTGARGSAGRGRPGVPPVTSTYAVVTS